MTLTDLVWHARRDGGTVELAEGKRLRLNGPMTFAARNQIHDHRDDVVSMIELERRLTTGYMKCDRVAEEGGDLAPLEDFWIALLHQYEAVAGQSIA